MMTTQQITLLTWIFWGGLYGGGAVCAYRLAGEIRYAVRWVRYRVALQAYQAQHGTREPVLDPRPTGGTTW
jgi:hypothetical protein